MRQDPRTKNRLMNEINVVPYIDVMLVLLVIFMVTAPLMNPGQIDLPSVGKALKSPVAPLEIMIRKDLSLAMRDHSKRGGESKVSRDELIAILKSRQGGRLEQTVVISADRNVRYEEVIKMMDVLKKQNVQKVGLLTQTGSK